MLLTRMAKVFPQTALTRSRASSSSGSSSSCYTIWMKSLLLSGNGCTVFSSKGKLVYRVDNYGSKSRDEVFFMDHEGKTLLKILTRKKLRLFLKWEGYQYDENCCESQKKPWFKVKKLKKKSSGVWRTKVAVNYSDQNQKNCYRINGLKKKSTNYKITDIAGRVVAEIRRKETEKGIALGEDVLKLVIEPDQDHLLIMGLVIVCGLIDHYL